MDPDSALTRCPNCQTVFAVEGEDLARAGGRVRCGDCLGVFDARANALNGEEIEAALPAQDTNDHDVDDVTGDDPSHGETATSLSWTLLEPVGIDGGENASPDAPEHDATPDAHVAAPTADAEEQVGAEDGWFKPADAVEAPAPAVAAEPSIARGDSEIESEMATPELEEEKSADTSASGSEFRFGDDTPPEMLEAELDALLGDDGEYADGPPPVPEAPEYDLTTTMSDVGDVDLFDDDWDDLLNEIDDDDSEPVSMTLIDDADTQAPPLDFELNEQDTPAFSGSVDLDLSRADDALSAPDSIENLTLAGNTDYRMAPDLANAADETHTATSGDTHERADETATDDSGETVDAPAATQHAGNDNAEPVDDGAGDFDVDALNFDADAVTDILSARDELLASAAAAQPSGDDNAPNAKASAVGDADEAPGGAAASDAGNDNTSTQDDNNRTEDSKRASGDSISDTAAVRAALIATMRDGDADAQAAGDAAAPDSAGESSGSAAATASGGDTDTQDAAADAADDVERSGTVDDAEAGLLAELEAARASANDAPPDEEEAAEELGEVIILSGDPNAFDEPEEDFAESMILTPEPAAPPRRRGLWLGLSAVALLALALQTLHSYRGDIATIEPWGGYLSGAYALIGRPVVPLWNATQMCVERSGGALAENNLLEIETVFSNRGDKPMPMPILKLRITDAYSDTLAGVIIAPPDYLPATDPRQKLQPGEQATALASLDYDEPRLDGFEVSLCYPGEDGKLRCALRCEDDNARR